MNKVNHYRIGDARRCHKQQHPHARYDIANNTPDEQTTTFFPMPLPLKKNHQGT